MLPPVKCSAITTTLKKSGIFHPDAGQGLFAVQPVGMGRIVGYYYGSSVYEGPNSGGFRYEMSGNRAVNVTSEIVLKWAKRLPETATDRNAVHCPLQILPAPFCAMPYVNDGEYLPGNEGPESRNLGVEWRNNVKFYQTESPSSTTCLTTYKLQAVRSLRNLKYDEDLFVY